ncbi:hypothetical protein [Devosia sp. 2618]|uniref:hypothetical protein n=1 Tax=Devosia sp. 2618 TaxID=3156454 RepID=UPI003397AE7C
MDTYSRPEAPQQGNSFLDFARALGEINPVISSFVNEEAARQQKAAEDRALRRIGGMSFEEARSAVESGTISEMDNPWFKSAFMRVLGERTAYNTINTLSEQYATDPNRHEMDFSTFVRENASNDLAGFDDPSFSAGYLPAINNFEASGAAKHTDIRSARAIEEAQANVFGVFLGQAKQLSSEGKDPKVIAGELFARYGGNEEFLRLDRNQQDELMYSVIDTLASEGDWELVQALLQEPRQDEYGNTTTLGTSATHASKVAGIVEKARDQHGKLALEQDTTAVTSLFSMAEAGNLSQEYLDQWREQNPNIVDPSRATQLILQSNRAQAKAQEDIATAQQKSVWQQEGARDVMIVDTGNLSAVTSGTSIFNRDIEIADGKGGTTTYTAKQQDEALAKGLVELVEAYSREEGVTPDLALDREVKLFATAGIVNERWSRTLAGGVSQATPANLKQFLESGDAVLPPALADGIKLYEELSLKSPLVLSQYFNNSDNREFFELVVAAKKYANAEDDYAAVRMAAYAQQQGKPSHPMASMTYKQAEAALAEIRVGGWNGIGTSEPANAGIAMNFINRAMDLYGRVGVIGDPAQKSALEQFKNTHVDINGFYVNVDGKDVGNREQFGQAVDLVFSEIVSDTAHYLNGQKIEASDLTLVPTSNGTGEWLVASKASFGAFPLAGVEPINLQTMAGALQRQADIDATAIEYEQRKATYLANISDAQTRKQHIDDLSKFIGDIENFATSDHLQRAYGARWGSAKLAEAVSNLPASIAARKAELEKLRYDDSLYLLDTVTNAEDPLRTAPATPNPSLMKF